MKATGIILLVAGLLLTIFTSFKFFTKEEVVDIGKLEITRDKPHHVSWPPVVGVVIMAVGGVLVWQGVKR